MEYVSCLKKQQEICEEFGKLGSSEALYRALIALGQKQKPLSDLHKSPENKIEGCQSSAYLHAEINSGKIYFYIEADALISAGLGQLVSRIYSGEAPEAILKCPPDCFEKIGLQGALSPSRSNGLANMLLKCKQAALSSLISAV